MLNNKARVREFLTTVRSGQNPAAANDYLAETVQAHQVVSEVEHTVARTPQNYTDHVQWMLRTYGAFSFEIVDLLADGDRVYARWKQTGRHVGEVEGFAPTGKSIIEVASATYRLVDGRIVEYWIQIDREGLRVQLEAHTQVV